MSQIRVEEKPPIGENVLFRRAKVLTGFTGIRSRPTQREDLERFSEA